MLESLRIENRIFAPYRFFAIRNRIRNRKLTTPRTMTAYLRIPAFLNGLLCIFFFSACADQPLEKVSVATEEGCQLLRQIIADHPTQFASFRRGAPSSNAWQNASIWNAKPLYPETTCQIWGWAKGRSNYSCQWKESSQEAARSAYEQYKPEIQSCLGGDWSPSEPQAKTGKETVFRSQSTGAVVSIRYFQDTRPPFSKPWYTSTVIGDLVEPVKE
jgi:hypothetical protein